MWHAEFEAHLKTKFPAVNLKWYYGCGGVRVYREPYVQFLWETWKEAINVAYR